jgi:hypothetical protein
MISVFYEHPTGFRFNLSESEYQQIENKIYKNPVFWIKTSLLVAQKVIRLYMNCFVFALFFRFALTYNTSKQIDFHYVVTDANMYFHIALIPFLYLIWHKSREYYKVKNKMFFDIVKQQYPEKLENLEPVLLNPKDLYDPNYVAVTCKLDHVDNVEVPFAIQSQPVQQAKKVVT